MTCPTCPGARTIWLALERYCLRCRRKLERPKTRTPRGGRTWAIDKVKLPREDTRTTRGTV